MIAPEPAEGALRLPVVLFSLIRVYRFHIQRVNQSGSDEKLLSQLKWPVEYMMVGLRPTWNITPVTNSSGFVTGGNVNVWRDWHRLTKMVDVDCDQRQLAETTQFAFSGAYTTTGPIVLNGLSNGVDVNAAASGSTIALTPAASGVASTAFVTDSSVAWACSNIGEVVHTSFALEVQTCDTLTLTAHGITIFDTFNSEFFNAYMPFNYGGPALVTPYDIGAMFVNFALFPRSYQPSGQVA